MGTAIVGIALVVIVALIIRKLIKDKMKGVGCSCGCEGCSHKCH